MELNAVLDSLKRKGLVPGKHFAFDETGVVFHGNWYPRISAEYDIELETVRFRPLGESNGTGPRILLLHGFSSQHSHSGSMLSILNILSHRELRRGRGAGTKRRRFSIVRELHRRDLLLLTVSAEAVDLPFHGAGPRSRQLRDLGYCVEWLEKALLPLASSGNSVPIVRSGSLVLIAALLRENPRAFAGLVLVSPFHPTIGAEEGFAKDLEQIEAGEFLPNLEGWIWFRELVRQSRWDDAWAEILSDRPLLAVFGTDDPDVQPEAFREFERLIAISRFKGHDSDLLIVAGGGHDVLNTRDDSTSELVYTKVFQFLKRFDCNE